MHRWTIGIFILIAFVASVPLPALANASAVFHEVDFDQHLRQALPLNVLFKNESGQLVPLSTFFDKRPVVLLLGYLNCPNLCSTTLTGVRESLQQSGLKANQDYNAIFVSIDSRDTLDRPALKKTALWTSNNTTNHWHFLTGPEASIKALAGAIGFRYFYDKDIQQYAHPAGFVIVTPKGNIARYFFGVRFVPWELRAAIIDASGERIGNLADRLLLLCYHYDPRTGKYNLAVMKILQMAAAALLVTFGLFVWHSISTERQQKNTNVRGPR